MVRVVAFVEADFCAAFVAGHSRTPCGLSEAMVTGGEGVSICAIMSAGALRHQRVNHSLEGGARPAFGNKEDGDLSVPTASQTKESSRATPAGKQRESKSLSVEVLEDDFESEDVDVRMLFSLQLVRVIDMFMARTVVKCVVE